MGDLRSVYLLNAVGQKVWQCLDGQTSVSEIVHAIQMEYDASAEQIEQDILAFLQDLRQAKLLQEPLSSMQKVSS